MRWGCNFGSARLCKPVRTMNSLQLQQRPCSGNPCRPRRHAGRVIVRAAPKPLECTPQEHEHAAQQGRAPLPHLRCPRLAAACAAVLLMTALSPDVPQAAAEIQTVTSSQALQTAKPLPKQTADKSKIWTLFLGGAAMLYVGTLAAENNSAWFPAIAKANKAMAMSQEAAKKAEQQSSRK